MSAQKKSASQILLGIFAVLMLLSAVLALLGQAGFIPGVPAGSMGVSIIDVIVSVVVSVLALRAIGNAQNMTKFVRGAWQWFPFIWDAIGVVVALFTKSAGSGPEYWAGVICGLAVDLVFALVANAAAKSMGVSMRS